MIIQIKCLTKRLNYRQAMNLVCNRSFLPLHRISPFLCKNLLCSFCIRLVSESTLQMLRAWRAKYFLAKLLTLHFYSIFFKLLTYLFRTDIFMKSNKHFASIRFFIPLLYVFFVGIFAIDQCKTPSLLNRDQTDEWKGWMQLVILIYHVTGASAVSASNGGIV